VSGGMMPNAMLVDGRGAKMVNAAYGPRDPPAETVRFSVS
jgi:hypothetical protein